MSVLEVVAAFLLLVGTSFGLLGALGLQRFPDLFARMHAATKPVTLGLACTLFGAALLQDEVSSAVKLVLAALLQYLTAPVAAHMIARAAYRTGTEMSPETVVDELAGAGVRPPHDYVDPDPRE